MIRALTIDDLAAADVVLQPAFGVPRSFAPRVARYLAIQPDGWLAYQDAGRLVGTVGGVAHEGLMYVGLMGVLPEVQGRGIGRQLLERLLAWAEGRGVRCAALDATEAGARLYERLGFVDAGPTHELVAPAQAPRGASTVALAVGDGATAALADGDEAAATAGVGVALGDAAIAVAQPSDEPDIRALDAALFAVRRDRTWDRLFAECAGRVLVARGRGGALDGYLCPLPEAIGPWGARDRETAAALLAAAPGVGAVPRVLVPDENRDALDLLAAAGFTIKRTLRHMRRGTPPRPLDWRAIYGKASYCLG